MGLCIVVQNTLGIRKMAVDLPPGKVTEVCGPNSAGKTSLCIAAAAVLCHDANPGGLKATEARRVYGHVGTEDARVELKNGEETLVAWLPLEARIEAPANLEPLCVPEAVGRVDFTAALSPRHRAELLQGVLLPPPEQIAERLREQLGEWLEEKEIVGVLEAIEERGWSKAEGTYSDSALRDKRKWAKITGDGNWGADKAQDWRPDGWLSKWESMTPAEHERDIDASRSALATLEGEEVLTEQEVEKAAAAKRSLPGLRKKATAIVHAHARAKASAGEAEEAARAAATRSHSASTAYTVLAKQKEDAETNLSCPSCGSCLLLIDDELVEEDHEAGLQLDQAIDGARETREQAQNDYRGAEELRAEARERMEMAAVEMRSADDAVASATRVADVKGEPADTEARQRRRADLERDIEEAVLRGQMIAQVRSAGLTHESVLRNLRIAEAIGPKGVRAGLLEQGRSRLQGLLHLLTEVSGWPTLVVDKDALYGGPHKRSLWMSSESEKWRYQAMMQIALAVMAGSPVVVLDRGDVLDRHQQHGLERLVEKVHAHRADITVLLAATRNSDEYKPPWRQVKIQDGKIDWPGGSLG